MANSEVKVDRHGVKRPYANEEPATIGQLDRIKQSEYGEHSGIKRSRSYSDFQSSDTGYTSESETVCDSAMESKPSTIDSAVDADEKICKTSLNVKHKHRHHSNTVLREISRESSQERNGDIGNGEGCGNAVLGEANGETADNNTDNGDNISEISGMSDISLSGAGRWHPMKGMMSWIHRQMDRGTDPRDVLHSLVPADTEIPSDWDNLTLWRLIISLMSEPPRRKRLHNVTTIEDVVRLLQTSNKILVLTGAGVSVSCGIPDFRSANGIYSRLSVDYPDLPNPQAMFDISYFRRNPKPFFQFAKEIYPGQFEPSLSHRFIRQLECNGRLLRNYTQNIDTLEQSAGITNVVQCHGSFATATCMVCQHHVDSEAVRADIMNQVIPKCPRCDPSNAEAILKPDIVFFGQSLPEEFHRQMQVDKDDCDLLIVIGSSLKVQPVALIPSSLPASVPQILINREPLRHLNFDVELLGDGDIIINELCHRLGGEHFSALCVTHKPATLLTHDQLVVPPTALTAPISDGIANSDDSKTLPSASVSTVDISSCRSSNVEVLKEMKAELSEDPTQENNLETNHVAGERPVSPGAVGTNVKVKPISWGTLLKDNSFVQLCPRRCVFHGAEVSVGVNECIANDNDDNNDDDDEEDHYNEDDEDSSDESDMSSLGSNVLTDGDEQELDIVYRAGHTGTGDDQNNKPNSASCRRTPVDLAGQTDESSNDSVDP